MQQVTESLKSLHEETKQGHPRTEKGREAVESLREVASLIARDAVMFMVDDLLVKALEMSRAIADFCNEYEE